MPQPICRFTPNAKEDLQSVFHYIAEDNPIRAITFLNDLRQFCIRAADFPRLGRAAPEMGPQVRMRVYQNYLVYYSPATDYGCIDILRIINAKQRRL